MTEAFLDDEDEPEFDMRTPYFPPCVGTVIEQKIHISKPCGEEVECDLLSYELPPALEFTELSADVPMPVKLDPLDQDCIIIEVPESSFILSLILCDKECVYRITRQDACWEIHGRVVEQRRPPFYGSPEESVIVTFLTIKVSSHRYIVE